MAAPGSARQIVAIQPIGFGAGSWKTLARYPTAAATAISAANNNPLRPADMIGFSQMRRTKQASPRRDEAAMFRK